MLPFFFICNLCFGCLDCKEKELVVNACFLFFVKTVLFFIKIWNKKNGTHMEINVSFRMIDIL